MRWEPSKMGIEGGSEADASRAAPRGRPDIRSAGSPWRRSSPECCSTPRCRRRRWRPARSTSQAARASRATTALQRLPSTRTTRTSWRRSGSRRPQAGARDHGLRGDGGLQRRRRYMVGAEHVPVILQPEHEQPDRTVHARRSTRVSPSTATTSSTFSPTRIRPTTASVRWCSTRTTSPAPLLCRWCRTRRCTNGTASTPRRLPTHGG